jgi:hypothetical protein
MDPNSPKARKYPDLMNTVLIRNIATDSWKIHSNMGTLLVPILVPVTA